MYVKWQASERGVEEQTVIDEITSGKDLASLEDFASRLAQIG